MYIQFADVSQFIEQMKASSVGRLIADERIAPLVEGVYGAVKDEYEKVRDNMGVSLEQLQTLFTGELCFAVAGFEDRSPGVVLLFDYDPEAGTLDALVGNEWIRGNLELESGEPIQEADVSIQTWKAGDTTVYYFMHDGTFAVGTDVEMMKEMLARWRGEAVGNDRTLAQNRKFVTIMNRCRGTKETPPEARFFVDPIDLAKALTRGNLGRAVCHGLAPHARARRAVGCRRGIDLQRRRVRVGCPLARASGEPPFGDPGDAAIAAGRLHPRGVGSR